MSLKNVVFMPIYHYLKRDGHMNEAQTLEQKVKLYVEWTPDNPYYGNYKYLDELGMQYGYGVVFKEIKRQKKDYI